MALPIVRSLTETRTSSDATTFTVNMPASRPNGRLYLLCITADGSDPIADPSGWTRIARATQGSTDPVSGWIGWRIGSSEPATYTVNTDASASERFAATVVGIDRFNASTPIDTSATNSGAGTAPASSGITTSVADCLAIWSLSTDTSGTLPSNGPSGPSGYVGLSQVTPTTDAGLAVYGKPTPAAGSVAGATGTLASSDDWIVFAAAVAGDLNAPEITSSTADAGAYILDAEAGVVLAGLGFEAAKGAGKLELWSNSTGSAKVVQTTTAWSNTSITFTAGLGGLTQGRLYAVVTTDGGRVSEPFRVVAVSATPDTKIVSVRVSANTSTGDQDITSAEISGITPKAVLFRMIRATADGAEDHLGLCIGAAVSSSSRFASAVKHEDAVATLDLGRTQFNDGCLAMMDVASNSAIVEAKADFVSFISGGCRINWSDAPPAAHQIIATFFCGSLVQASITNSSPTISWNPSVTTTKIYTPITTAIGDPDFVFASTLATAVFNTGSAGSAAVSWGAVAMGGFELDASHPQCSSKVTYSDNVASEAATANAYTTGFLDFSAVGSSNGRLYGRRWYMDRDIGYSLYTDQTFALSTRPSSFLELILPGTRCWAGSIDPRTSSGSQSITSPGWKPQWVSTTQNMVATLGTTESDDDANAVSIASFTATVQQATGIGVDDGSTGSDTISYVEDQAIYLRDPPNGVLFSGSFTSMDATGWTWNFTTANGTQRRWLAWAIEEPEAAPVTITGTLSGSFAPSGSLAGSHGVSGALAGSLAPLGAFSGSHGVSGAAAGSVSITGSFSGTSGEVIVPSVLLTANAKRPLGAISRMWRPSTFYLSSTPQIYSQFQAIPGPRGIVRLQIPFGATDMSAATSLSDYVARVTAYCSDPRFTESISRGTCCFEINGMPLFLSSDFSTVTAISKAASAVVTAVNNLVDGDRVTFHSVLGMVEINGLSGTVSGRTASQFTVNINTTGFTTYSGGGRAARSTFLAGSGWAAYRAARATSLDDFEETMFELADKVMNDLGHPAPRNPETGAIEIGRPGVLFEFWNEPNGLDQFLGYRGSATMRDYLLMYERAHIAGKSANAQFAIGGPVTAGYQNQRIDRINATTSADLWTGGRFAGGTEGVGRQSGVEFRNYFMFNAAQVAVGPIESVRLKTFAASPTGDVSADTASLRPYNVNGQGDPAADATATAHARCGSGTPYVTGYTAWRASGSTTIDLGAQAALDLETAAAASVPWSVSSTMPGAGSGSDRTMNPRGFDFVASDSAHLLVTYAQTMIEQFCDFSAENDCEPDFIVFHNFQNAPDQAVSAAQALVASALSSSGLDAGMPVILTEYQHSDKAGPQAGVRDDYRSAAYTLGTLWEHWQAGFDAMCQVLIKYESSPPVSGLFTDSWGMIVNGTSSGYYPAASSFMAMRLFSQWRDPLSRSVETELSELGNGLRCFAARYPSGMSVVVSRWDPTGPATVDLETRAIGAKPVLYSDVYRFTSTINDPSHVYATAPGTDAQRAQAAVDASAAAVGERHAGDRFAFALGPFDSFVAQFTYDSAAWQPGRLRKRTRQELEDEVQEWQEPLPLEIAEPEVSAELEMPAEETPEPAPEPVVGVLAATILVRASFTAKHTNPYEYARRRMEDLALLGVDF